MKKEMIKKRVKITILSLFMISMLSLGIFILLNWNKISRNEELIDLGDNSLSLRDYGNGKPVVIIEAGLNCRKQNYYILHFLTSFKSRVIAYDHAGIGKSTANSNPRTLPYYVQELKALLKYKNLQPPYILIGHSLGGHIIRYFAYLYPGEVAGLIFLDHPHEDWFRYIRSEWSLDDQKKYFNFWDPEINRTYTGVAAHELLEYEANCDSIRGKEIPLNIPVLMFTGRNLGHFRKDSMGILKDTKAWVEMQKSLIQNHPLAKHIIDLETGHWPQNDKPLFIQREINNFIEECRKRDEY